MEVALTGQQFNYMRQNCFQNSLNRKLLEVTIQSQSSYLSKYCCGPVQAASLSCCSPVELVPVNRIHVAKQTSNMFRLFPFPLRSLILCFSCVSNASRHRFAAPLSLWVVTVKPGRLTYCMSLHPASLLTWPLATEHKMSAPFCLFQAPF